MTSVTPMSRTTGYGKANRDLQARARESVLGGISVGQAARPEVAVGEPGQPEHGGAADCADEDLRPHRPQREAEALALAAAVVQQPMMARQPTMAISQVTTSADRAERAAADELEGGIEAGHGRALRLVPDHAANREQAAQRDDERRHADVGDDEALEGADRRTDADPAGQRERPTGTGRPSRCPGCAGTSRPSGWRSSSR